MKQHIGSKIVLIGFVLISLLSLSCRSRTEATSKGVVGYASEPSGEKVALVLYEYSFDDPALPSTFAALKNGQTNVPVANALCLYMNEYDASATVSEEDAIELFKKAKSVTAYAISRTGLDQTEGSLWEGMRSALSLRSNTIWAGNDLVQDEIYGLRNPLRQATLRETRTSIRTLRRYVELAQSHEDPNGRACPPMHPRAEKIKNPSN